MGGVVRQRHVWPDLLPRHPLTVGGAAVNPDSQIGAFLTPYSGGAAQDETRGFKVGLTGLAILTALAVAVVLRPA